MSSRNARPVQIDANRPKRILFATIGSLGDLHPCVALALELKRRGHRVTIATTPHYRAFVEKTGIGFLPLRPDWDPTNAELIRQCEDIKRGPEILYRRMILPHLRNTFDDLLSAAAQADLMISGELVYAAPLVVEKLGLPWISAILSPFSFFSAQDPSIMVNAQWLIRLRKAGPFFYRVGMNLGRLATRHWSNPVRQLRRELGLRSQCDPVFRDKFSPDLVLALFSPLLAPKQLDWPPQTFQAGFVYYEGQAGAASDIEILTTFLASGEAPVVFTQGSTAVHNPGDFYTASMEAAKRVGRRAVLLGINRPTGEISPGILALRYAPYSRIFPYAAVNVHQGGSGTTGQALLAGRPMLIVPYGWDQPDNGARVERLGAGLCIPRSSYTTVSAQGALKRLLTESQFAIRAAEAAAKLQQEDGLTRACEAITGVLERVCLKRARA